MQFQLTKCHSDIKIYGMLQRYLLTPFTRGLAMIRCHLARMMGEHKMRIADVARETGLSRATVTLLYKETAQKVDLEAIEKLCLLFECQVGDLLELTTA
ncbi:helix-turn-helix domain-containing protein [Vibrio cholerae]